MIFELLLTPIFRLIELLIGLIPDMSYVYPSPDFDISGFIYFLAYGFWIFPFHLFLIFVTNVIYWLGVHKVWAFIEWAYRKIPGVN